MKQVIYGFTILCVITICFLLSRLSKVNKELSITYANLKAYSMEIDTLNKSNRALYLNTQQLNTYNDTLIKRLLKTKEELKIKDNKLKSLQLVEATTEIVDTVVFTDTIFVENFKCDTTLVDPWYNIGLHLEYPSTIVVNPSIKTEQHIIVSYKKETIRPPRKFFLFRWFQKKHNVLNVDVVEQNPYVQIKEHKYIEILK